MVESETKRSEFIAVGTELLSSVFLETNSLFLAEKLEELGLRLSFKTVVSDELKDIKEALTVAKRRSQLIFISGGLGPTEDDRTREGVAKVLKKRLIFRPDILEKIKKRFESRGLTMPLSNRRQAYVIEGAEVLDNPNGTAPGLWLETKNYTIVLLPGPPAELQPMMENLVGTRLGELKRKQIIRAIIKIAGAGESWIEDQIKPVYTLLSKNLELTILASPGDVQIRLSMLAKDNEEKKLEVFERIKSKIIGILGEKVYSISGELLEEVVGRKLVERKKTLACAESCSGGLLTHRITNIPGSSNYFLEGLVTYSNQAKIRELGVSEKLIREKGAVSQEVAEAMAEGVRKKTGADFALSTTGIAGPGGGMLSKPVGLVYVGLAWSGGTLVERNLFKGTRDQIKFQATQKALDMLRLKLIEFEKKESKQ
jgi:nicotinamide-nucleotide amidase